MLELNRHAGTALVLVTHDTDVAAVTERTIRLRNGEMVGNDE
jgi:predicted ABC-type transport system involved in lysophospholipase L1 biosynthesis ATPase subunit